MSDAAKIFLTLFCTYAFFTNTYLTTNDAPRFCTAAAIVDSGRLEISECMSAYFPQRPGREGWAPHDFAKINGKYYSDKAPLGSFLAVPVYFAVTRVTRQPGIVIYLVSLFTAGLLTALTALMLAALARDTGAGRRMGMLVAAAYGLGSMALFYACIFFSSAVTAFFTCAAFFLLSRAKTGRASPNVATLAGACAALSIMSDYYAAVSAAALLLYAAFKPRVFARAAAGFALTIPLLLLYHYALTGNPLVTPYRYSYYYETLHKTGFYGVGIPGAAGARRLFELLFSPIFDQFLSSVRAAPVLLNHPAEKWGLFITCAPVLFSIFYFRRFMKYRAEAAAIALTFFGFLFVNMSMGWFDAYSARFFMPALPLLFIPMLTLPVQKPLVRNLLFFTVGFSIAVNIMGTDRFMPQIKSLAHPGTQNIIAQLASAYGIHAGFYSLIFLPVVYGIIWLLIPERTQ